MIDPDELLVRAVARALDDSGLAPAADEDDAKEFLKFLWEQGYEVSKTTQPSGEDEEEDEQ